MEEEQMEEEQMEEEQMEEEQMEEEQMEEEQMEEEQMEDPPKMVSKLSLTWLDLAALAVREIVALLVDGIPCPV